MSEYALPGRSQPYAKILGRIGDCTFTRNGIDQSFRHEKNRNKSDAFRQNRQDGLFDSALRSFLFLYSVCRCIQSSPRQHPRILPLRSNFLGRSNPLPRGLNTSTPKSGFFWQEFSHWYRCRPFRQTCNDGRICFQPQSDIRGLCFCLAWTILGVPQLDFVGLPGCRHLAVPPSSIARRGIPEEALWPRVRGVLQSSKKIPLSGPYEEM